jgi:simple sugar transport system permease protein
MTFFADIIAATFRNATPLVYGTVGETYTERAGILNLGIEGTMYAGAFFGFAVAFYSGDAWIGLGGAIVVGLIAGAIMALLTVTLGANQHVSGLGLTIVLIGVSEFANRLLFTGSTLARIEPMPLWDPLGGLAEGDGLVAQLATIANQYGLTYVAFFLVVPAAWWVLGRTPLGLSIRAVGENPEAADVAGIDVFRIRYIALMIGGAFMAVGGAFITLAMLGTFTLDIIAGRGWVVIALVIFGRWRIFRGVLGALVFAAVYSLGLRLRITPGFEDIPNEIMLALPYVVVIIALALSGRNVPYPGAYLKPYRRT